MIPVCRVECHFHTQPLINYVNYYIFASLLGRWLTQPPDQFLEFAIFLDSEWQWPIILAVVLLSDIEEQCLHMSLTIFYLYSALFGSEVSAVANCLLSKVVPNYCAEHLFKCVDS